MITRSDGIKTLQQNAERTFRKKTYALARHGGVTLSRLEKEERRLTREFHSVGGGTERDPYAHVYALAALIKAIDATRERRRIILGIPLPGLRDRQRTLDMGPTGPTMDAQLIADSTSNISPAQPTPTEEPR